ncbi:amino acid ABC transporter membrane protein 1, PAAT family [Quadrisphaera granulorum]|uniref:Amino acid ABC transporter membrane protein 1 (PAAT family) n=1 Tax=Quadrisphaera granulorum TaxID=317664 RepID=A0A316A7N0_9ACTN|nr:amino acid ABC transporter permease [Quadrisphaera granulorum]PWJ53871.1 amino acid ABC transporter membrane protein 1 (PAAT family) [Quadrisphaera granulorum]SZE96628.1 amino acid ABC transporter membrane protein 1, PAAT family [Quadrisphaera granulorum]
MEHVSAVLLGVPYTLLVTVVALAIGAVLGLPLALARRSPLAVLNVPARVVIDVLRGIPPVVWLFIIFFGIGNQFVTLDPIQAGSLGLGLISAAYLAEIYRSGLGAVHSGQWEASSALGLSRTDSMVRVVGPQAFRVALPAASTYAIGLLKDSSVVSAIGVADIVFQATGDSRATGAALAPFLVAAAIYILLGTPLAIASRRMDSRLRMRVAR